ncbi:MAG: N-acetylmuramoyl-L-alanine amidase, partial [Ktedonobacteraceae bacterium]
MPFRLKHLMVLTLVALVFSLLSISFGAGGKTTVYAANTPADAAFSQAANESGVPASILKGLCYMEGRLSMHGGSPSIDNGYGCMHLVKNEHADTLDQAARLLQVSVSQLKTDFTTNIRGGAAVLRVEALQLSGTHSLPTSLAGWYGEIANYSHSTIHATALMYADAFYELLKTGFQARTDAGELVTLAAQTVSPQKATATAVSNASTVPAGCTIDNKVDYPAAVDCLLNPNVYDCNIASPGNSTNPCSYDGANRPTDLAINTVVIHDSEGSLTDDFNIFDDVTRRVSTHYIVDTDGTVYQ